MLINIICIYLYEKLPFRQCNWLLKVTHGPGLKRCIALPVKHVFELLYGHLHVVLAP
jgi:hypothetical protein